MNADRKILALGVRRLGGLQGDPMIERKGDAMGFQNASVAHKLWALVRRLLFGMVGLLVSLQLHTVNVATRTAQLGQFNEERALLATR